MPNMKKGDLYSGAGSEWDENDHPRDESGKFSSKVDSGLVDFVNNIYSLPDKAQYVVGEVSDRARTDIERLTGEKLSATQHVINASEVRHIIERHGVSGKQDHSMANLDDIGIINDVIKNYDSLDWVRDGKGNIQKASGYFVSPTERASVIKYRKDCGANEMYIVEALTDTRKGVLHIISAYKKEKTLN